MVELGSKGIPMVICPFIGATLGLIIAMIHKLINWLR
jgi:hypothetical protein